MCVDVRCVRACAESPGRIQARDMTVRDQQVTEHTTERESIRNDAPETMVCVCVCVDRWLLLARSSGSKCRKTSIRWAR